MTHASDDGVSPAAIFHVLLVDDEEACETEKLAPLIKDPAIELVRVESLAAARASAAERFFHLALVDLQLDTSDDSNVDGRYFLRELYEGRPACQRVLFTRTSADHRDALFALANPDGPIIHGALDKSDFKLNWLRWVKRCATRWQKRALAIEGFPALRAALDGVKGEAHFGGAAAVVTDAELQWVVSTLFGRTRVGGISRFAIDRIALSPLPGGKSQATVFLARLTAGDLPVRVTCVVKVAPRRDSEQERSRYERFVRFRVSPDQRAELLGACLGDTVGAAAYAFAGRAPDDITDLEGYFEREDESAAKVLGQLFNGAHGDLWSVVPAGGSDEVADLGNYFDDEYGLDAAGVGEDLLAYATKNAAAHGLVPKGLELVGRGGKLVLPRARFFGGPKVRMAYHASLVHGDLNGRNILISDDERVRLIDFRHAGVGPVAVDFAALEASVRLSCDLDKSVSGGLLALQRHEHIAVSRAWTGARASVQAPPEPYWVRMSIRLAQLCNEVAGEVTHREYLATCLLYALRLFGMTDLERGSHARLLPWVAATYQALDRLAPYSSTSRPPRSRDGSPEA